MRDYVADYVAEYADKVAAERETQLFWSIVYDMMNDGYSEDQALKIVDSRGVRCAKYPRPEGFPSSFAEDA